jgi:hypothetical protein
MTIGATRTKFTNPANRHGAMDGKAAVRARRNALADSIAARRQEVLKEFSSEDRVLAAILYKEAIVNLRREAQDGLPVRAPLDFLSRMFAIASYSAEHLPSEQRLTIIRCFLCEAAELIELAIRSPAGSERSAKRLWNGFDQLLRTIDKEMREPRRADDAAV